MLEGGDTFSGIVVQERTQVNQPRVVNGRLSRALPGRPQAESGCSKGSNHPCGQFLTPRTCPVDLLMISSTVAEFDRGAAGAELSSSEVELGELRPPKSWPPYSVR